MAAVTNLLYLAGGIPTGIGSADTVTAPGDWTFSGTGTATFSGNVSIAGNLDVTGEITSRGQVNLTIQDPFIDLGLGNSTTTSQAGGFSVQMAAAAGVTAASVHRFVTATQFEINDTGATALVANQIIAVTGLPTEFASNEGFYAVASVSGTAPQVVNIKSTATPSAPLLQTAFNVTTTTVLDSGAAFQAEISTLAFANGLAFPDAGGTPYAAGLLIQNYAAAAVLADFTANAAWTAVGAGSTTLQNAYDNGPTIVTSASPIKFTLTGSGFDVESGAVNFGSGALSPLSSFAIESGSIAQTSTSTFDIDATGALSLNSSGGVINVGNDSANGQISIGTAGARNIVVGNAGTASITAITGYGFKSYSETALVRAGTSSSFETVGTGFSGATTQLRAYTAQGDANLRLYSTSVDPGGAGNILIESYGAYSGFIKIGTNSQTHPISIGTAGARSSISIGSIAALVASVEADTVNLANGAQAHTINMGTSAFAQTINIGSATGASSLIMDAGTGGVAINASSTGAIDIGTDSATGAISIGTAGARPSLDVGSYAVTAASLDAQTVNIANSAYNHTVNIATAGPGPQTITIGSDASSSALTLKGGTTGIIIDSGATGNISIGDTPGTGEVLVGSNGARSVVQIGNDLVTKVFNAALNAVQVLSDSSSPTNNPALGTGNVQILAGTAGGVGFSNSDIAIEAGNDITIGANNSFRLTSNINHVSLEAFDNAHGINIVAAGGVGMQVESTAGVAARRLVTIDYASNPTSSSVPKVVLADANSATDRFLAITSDAITATGTGFAATVYGSLALVTFDSSPASTDVGKPVYLSEAAGQASLTAPSTSGANVIRVGFLVQASGTSTCQIQFQPQFIAAIP